METLEDIEGLMKSHKNSMGTSLFDHISQVVNTLKNNPNKTMEDPYQYFETISHFIGKNQFDYKTPLSENEVSLKKPKQCELNQWLCNEKSLIYSREEQQGGVKTRHIDNLCKVFNMLEWAGLGFGKEENFRLKVSLKNLGEKTDANNLRFWGKILCRDSDFYVAEGEVGKKFADEIPAEMEPRGQEGVNKLTYWVTHDLQSDWTELPLILPKHIQQARKIKYLFSGDLEKQVDTYPEFEGQEKHLLKAQIARITYSTVLVPAEQYKQDEEREGVVVLNEESLVEGVFPAPNYEAIRNPETWCHLHPNIMSTGRVAHFKPPGTGDEWEEMQEKLNQQEEKTFNVIARLLPIANEERVYPDNSPKDEEQEEAGAKYKYGTNWLQRQHGDQQKYSKIGDEEGVTSYSVVTYKNLWWPGAYFVAQDGLWTSVYIGNGVKDQTLQAYPLNIKFQPENLQDEPNDREEHYEPVPKNAPKAKVENAEEQEDQ